MARVIGIDLGKKRIGIAVSDETQAISSTVKTLVVKSVKLALDYIAVLAKSYAAEKIVIGLPLNMNGTRGPEAEKALDFTRRLKHKVTAEVLTFDERLTTSQGEKILILAGISRKRRKEHIDKLAAQIMLQAYLDSNR